MTGQIFIITSPSGGGKGTLISEVLRSVPNIGYSVSFTTREMRDGEEDGKNYNFVSREDFENLIKFNEFLEYAEVHGNFYGTSKSQVLRETASGKDIILEIDVQGAQIVKKTLPKSIGIFILPPSFEVLKKRLEARQTESAASLELRLGNSREEVSQSADFDYLVINDDIVKAISDLQSIFYAERCRRLRQIEAVEKILKTFEK